MSPQKYVAMISITMATSEPIEPKAKQGKSRGICFTLYQYDSLLARLREEANNAEYLVFGYEICPDTGRPHLQGYIHYTNQHSLDKFSKTFNNCHVEKPFRTPKENREYCLKIRKQDAKANDRYEEFGELPRQGERTDWVQVYEKLKTNTAAEVIEEYPHLIPAQRAIRETKALILKPLHREVNVIVLVGKAGSGKTSWAYNNYSDIYEKPASEWWDHYSGEKVVLMDDFYGWIKYHDLLRVLDRYPYKVPYKGGYVNAQWDTVIITSNKEPDEWYKGGLTPALRRRIKKYILVTSIDGTPHYEEAQLPPSNEEVYEG